MKNAVFLVKNGIGFGHIRRALLLAEAMQSAERLRPVVVSQASSLALYGESPVRVVNFPLLHRVPSAITEDFYTDVLDHVLDRLDPAVVVEDTYPDARYRRLPSLADRPRVLVMRRLDGLSLDQIRQRGDLAHYDRILIAQDKTDFRQEGHSGETLAAVETSGRFAFVGNIAFAPRAAEVAAVRREYVPDGAPLVVVNGGAGGDQMADGYGHRLFQACQRVAATLAEERNPAVFALVTGPYYAGAALRPSPTVTVRRFEPRLAALLAAADVAVIKPGNNALSEALTGSARLVLVPDQSFMEGLDEHAARVAARYGGAVGQPDPASLDPLIREALARPPRQDRVTPSSGAVDAVVRELYEQADGHGRARIVRKGLLLMVLPGLNQDPLDVKLPPPLRDAVVVGVRRSKDGVLRADRRPAGAGDAYAVIVGGDPPDSTPQSLVDRGVRMVIQTSPSAAISRWLYRQPTYPALLVVPADRVVARQRFPQEAVRRIARLLRSQVTATVILDVARLSGPDLQHYLDHMGQWLTSQPVQLINLREVAAQWATRWVET